VGAGGDVGFDVGELEGEGVGETYGAITFTRVINFDPVSSIAK
jgi:hypothetical protein